MTRFAHTVMLSLAVAVALTAAGAGCSGGERPLPAQRDERAVDQAHVLRTYQVSPGQEKRAERLLREVSYPVQVVSAQGAQTQFVRLNPQVTGDGYFVLSAPASIHEGVRELLDKLAQTKAPPSSKAIETT